MIEFIKALSATDDYITTIFLNGGCYQLHLFLKTIYPECEPRITKDKSHVVTFYKGKYYDIRGEYTGVVYIMTNKEILMAEKWSFAKNMALQIKQCRVCGEPFII